MHIGATLGRRFTLVHPETTDLPGVERYVANDTRLNIEVNVDLITAVAPSAVRQRAARAALVRDPRLTRILSTERTRDYGGLTYVVTDRPSGTSLGAVMESRVLPTDIATAITVEVARVLAIAAARGVHHGFVRPEAITVTRRGRVMVSGLGTDGELASQARLLTSTARRERADAQAIGRLFVEAITGIDPDDATHDDVPKGLSDGAAQLCKTVLAGSGPRHLADIVRALQPHAISALPGIGGSVATWALRPAIIAAEQERLAQIAQWSNEMVSISDITLESAAHLAALRSIGHLAQPGLSALIPGVQRTMAPDTDAELDVDDFENFDLMAAEQNAEPAPAVWEELMESLHERWPGSQRVTRSLVWAHERAARSGPINAGPLLMALSVAALLIAVMVAFSLMSQPFVPDFPLYNPPANTYPEFTYSPSPEPTVSPSSD
ncbi:MAG: hypothetical protein WDZ57_03975 [Demequina sp.]